MTIFFSPPSFNIRVLRENTKRFAKISTIFTCQLIAHQKIKCPPPPPPGVCRPSVCQSTLTKCNSNPALLLLLSPSSSSSSTSTLYLPFLCLGERKKNQWRHVLFVPCWLERFFLFLYTKRRLGFFYFPISECWKYCIGEKKGRRRKNTAYYKYHTHFS